MASSTLANATSTRRPIKNRRQVTNRLPTCPTWSRLKMVMRKMWLLSMTVGLAWSDDGQSIFAFHNNFWVNLHHLLYEKAAAKTNESSDLKEWDAAVEYYRREVVKNDLLNGEMTAINNRLSE